MRLVTRLRHLPTACLCAAIVLTGCGGPKAFVRTGFLNHPPRRVAVLPFVITYTYDLTPDQSIPEAHRVGRDVFRKTFYHAFTPYGYDDVTLSEVDEQLTAAWGPLEKGAWRRATPQAIGAAIGADALIYGEVQRLMYFSIPLYTETSLAATLRMVETRTGDELWRQQVRAAERGGALMQKGQVVDFLQDQVRSFHPEIKFLRVADIAVHRALKGMPNPPFSGPEPATRGQGMGETDRKVVRLAVLPFDVKVKRWQQGAASLRAGVVANLQDGPFEIVEMQQVDGVLKEKGWKEGEPLPGASTLTELARTLGAKAWLRGTVTNWGRSYLVLESWVKAAAQLELVDAQSGEVVWSGQRKGSRTAGLLKGPTGFQSLATAPLMGLKTSHLERVADDLARRLAGDLAQSPAVMTYLADDRR